MGRANETLGFTNPDESGSLGYDKGAGSSHRGKAKSGETINDNYPDTLVNHMEESWSHASHPTTR